MTHPHLTHPQKQLDELEAKAAESALIAELATNPEVRVYNAGLAKKLRERANRLRAQQSRTPLAQAARHTPRRD